MAKTGHQIEGDVFRLLKASPLCAMISGKVYRQGTRPRDSKKEDVVVIFTGGLTEQIQSGVVTINIYVPDKTPNKNGVYLEDGARAEVLETAAQAWVESLASHPYYDFSLQKTIYTDDEPEIHQHFIVIKLKFNNSQNL